MVSMNGINQYKIVLRPDEVQEFVNEASRYDFDIDIAYNSYVVDAKSILGVYGLDLTRCLCKEVCTIFIGSFLILFTGNK